MHIDLSGKVALVTGGSRGIGRAIALRLGQSGAHVAIMARRPDVLEETLRELRAEAGGRITGYACDVTDSAAVTSAVASLAKEFGGVDILVNNAGSSVRRSLDALDRQTFEVDFDLKVLSAVHLCQLVVPHMRERKWGRIINIVSIYGKTPRAGSMPTNVSRAAGIAATKIMSGELAPDNILVNAICVGAIKSDQWTTFHQREAPELPFEEYLTAKGAEIPIGRIAEAAEVANVACFLASDFASYVTGTAINVDGGRSPVV